jgi:DNA-binding response OmpR family regulator
MLREGDIMDIKEEILNYLKNQKEVSSSELSREIKRNRITVSKYLELLQIEGMISSRNLAQARLWSLNVDHTKSKILVVDDEPHIVNLIKICLEDEHRTITEAFSGIDALEKVFTEIPDLVVLDIMMPGVSGYDVLKKMRQNKITRNIPVIILSAKAELEDKFNSLELGAHEHITKPFDPEELNAVVFNLLSAYKDADADLNPLTGLISKNALLNKKFSCDNKYKIHLVNFDEYKKSEGLMKANNFLRFFSTFLKEELNACQCTLGHLDDELFVVLSDRRIDVTRLNNNFKKMLPFFYRDLPRSNKISLKITPLVTL